MALYEARHQFVERRLDLLSATRPVPFLRVTHRRHARRFVDDDDLFVAVFDDDVRFFRRRLHRPLVNFHHLADCKSSRRIHTEVAVDGDKPCLDHPFDVVPGFAWQPTSESGRQRLLREFCRDVENFVAGHDQTAASSNSAKSRSPDDSSTPVQTIVAEAPSDSNTPGSAAFLSTIDARTIKRFAPRARPGWKA